MAKFGVRTQDNLSELTVPMPTRYNPLQITNGGRGAF
jgi:hypothetical protein